MYFLRRFARLPFFCCCKPVGPPQPTEGGGRKGLPKSFLNRFTRVKVELLQSKDLLFIAGSLHPRLPSALLGQMVQFMTLMHHDANILRIFASAGGPFEFNLRDLLRWCSLTCAAVAASSNRSASGDDLILNSIVHFAQLLFVDRMRHLSDRAHVTQCFHEAFRTASLSAAPVRPCNVAVSPETLQLGWAHLPRAHLSASPAAPDLQLLRSQLPLLEALAHCVQQQLPALLVGSTACGKSAAVQTLAALCGQPLMQISLNGSSDTSDLLGGFEQASMGHRVQQVGTLLRKTTAEMLALVPDDAADTRSILQMRVNCASTAAEAWASLQALQDGSDGPTAEAKGLTVHLSSLQEVLVTLRACLAHLPAEQGHAATLAALQAQCGQLAAFVAQQQTSKSAGRFEWVDGPLTRAVEHGHWVLIDGANLCNPTVLDRLNALLEPDGELFLTERGDVNGSPRSVPPHPNFRLFLTMDPRHGEVSRAMRNRSVELFLLPQTGDQQCEGEADEAAMLAAEGVAESPILHQLVQAHQALVLQAQMVHRHAPSTRDTRNLAALIRSLVERGWSLQSAAQASWHQVYVSGISLQGTTEAAQKIFAEHVQMVDGTQATDEVLARPSTWHLPLQLDHLAHSSSQQAILQDLVPLLMYLFRAVNLISHSHTPLDTAPVKHSHQQKPRGQAGLASLAASLEPSETALFSAFASLPGGWLQSLRQLDFSRQGGGAGLPRQLHGQLPRAWAALGIILERLTLEQRPVLEAYLTELAVQCKAGNKSSVHLPAGLLSFAAECCKASSKLALLPSVPPSGPSPPHPHDSKSCHSQPICGEAARSRALLRTEMLQQASDAILTSTKALQSQPIDGVPPASLLQQSALRFQHPEVARRTRPDPPVLDALFAAMTASLQIQREMLQAVPDAWEGELVGLAEELFSCHLSCWRCSHGGLGPLASPHACSGSTEALTFAWLRHLRCIQQLKELPGPLGSALSAAVRLHQAALDAMSTGLGVAGGLPPKPLLWKHAGHPSMAPSVKLAAALHRLQRMCHLAGAAGSMDDQKLMALAPSGAAGLSPQDIKLLLAHKPHLRQHLLDGLGLCYIACLPQSNLVQTSQPSASSQGQHTLPAALTTNIGSNNCVAEIPVSAALGSGNPPSPWHAKAKLVTGAEEAVQQIGEELENVIRVALESVTKNKDVLMVNKDQLIPAAVDNFASAEILEGAAEELSQPLTWLQGLEIWQQQHASLADAFNSRSGQAADGEAVSRSAVSNWISKPVQDVTSLIGFHLLAWHTQQGQGDLGHRANIIHEAIFRWHQASWMTQPVINSLPEGLNVSGGSSSAPWLEAWCQQALALTACRTKALLWMALHTPTPLCNRRMRSRQLQCAARQLYRLCCNAEDLESQQKLQVIHDWRLLAGLLSQLIQAHISSLPLVQQPIVQDICTWLATCWHPRASDRQQCEEAMTMLSSTLVESSHRTFSTLLQPLLLPSLLIMLCHHGIHDAKDALSTAQIAADARDAADRGRVWSMLGLMRLHLVMPPTGGQDPARRPALKAEFLSGTVSDVLEPELEARQLYQRLPLGPDGSVAIQQLHTKMQQLQGKLAKLNGQAVPRPEPSQYAAIEAEMDRFANSLGAISRVTSLLDRLQQAKDQGRETSALQEAMAWQQNAGCWAEGLLERFPLYTDLLQPVALAVYEIRAGLAMIVPAIQQHTQRKATAVHCSIAASLISIPVPSSGSSLTTAQGQASIRTLAAATAPAASIAARSAAAFSAQLGSLQAALELFIVTAGSIQPQNILHTSASQGQQAPQGAGKVNAEQGGQDMVYVEGIFRTLVMVWGEVKASQQARAEEEAELFKTKQQPGPPKTDEEEEEADFKRQFPDHGQAFADVAEMEGDESMLTVPDKPLVQDSTVDSAAAQELLHGKLLVKIVDLHDRIFTGKSVASPEPWHTGRRHCYQLAAKVLGQAHPPLPALLDGQTLLGHLLYLCQQATDLQTPSPSSAGEANVQEPQLAEMGLLEDPVNDMQSRVGYLLAEWPDNPLLLQLKAICQRLLELPVSLPLKTAMTGLELLLARAHLWDDTAAKHVSLTQQLRPLEGLAGRWRRLELASWRGLLHRVAVRHAQGASQSWFHLYQMMDDVAHSDSKSNGDAFQLLSSSAEDFMQTSTLGEYAMRLRLINSFRCHAHARACSGLQQAACLATTLANIHTYYGQFQAQVQTAIDIAMKELEKQLQDFVKLAKWEDRGYYSLQMATEKSQRQLHRLSRRAEQALRQPVANVLADASAAMGFPDLINPEVVVGLEGPIGSANVAEASMPQSAHSDALQDMVELVACSTAAAIGEERPSASTEPLQIRAAGTVLRQHELPRLAARLCQVLEASPSLAQEASPPGIDGIDGLAATAAQRALDLKEQTAKRARPLKKKALTDFLKALLALGVSRNRTAVPAEKRGARAWFAEPSPPRGLQPIIGQLGSKATAASTSMDEAYSLWSKAETYYFRSMARIQRLWRVAQTPHQDISAREVEASVHICEHLLFLQQTQRAMLVTLCQHQGQLDAHAMLASEFAVPDTKDGSGASVLPPQAVAQAWLQGLQQGLQQVQLVTRDLQLVAAAAADAESNPEACLQLKETSKGLQQLHARIQACQGAVPRHVTAPNSSTAGLVSLSAVGVLLAVSQDLISIQSDLEPQGALYRLRDSAPGFSKLQHMLESLTEQNAEFRARLVPPAASSVASVAARSAAIGTGNASEDGAAASTFSQQLEQVIKSVLLWAQAMHGPEAAMQKEKPFDKDGLSDNVQIQASSQQLVALLQPERTASIGSSLTSLCHQAVILADSTTSAGQQAAARAASQLSHLRPLLSEMAAAHRKLAMQYLELHKATTKLGYITSSLLAGVIASGFCTAQTTEEADNGDSRTKQTGGTGLGEGDTAGAKDITEEIENEDQLLGAQAKDQPQDQPQAQPQQPEQGKGVEMQDDFEGALEDMPEGGEEGEQGSDAEDQEEGEGEDRLDQTMGDVGDEGEVVDERLWGKDDKPEDPSSGKETLQSTKPLQGEQEGELEYQAGQEEEGSQGPQPKQRPEQAGQKAKDGIGEGEGPDEEGGEESADAEVDEGPVNNQQGQAQHQLQPTQQEDLELPDEMELDGRPGDQEGHEEGPEDGLDEEAEGEAGQGEPADPSQQPFPEQNVPEGPEPELTARPTDGEEEAGQDGAGTDQAGPTAEQPEQPMDIGHDGADGSAEAADDGPEPEDDEPEAHVQGQEESGMEQSMAREQAPQGGPKGIPTATVAGGMQQHGAGSTAREQTLQPEQRHQQQDAVMDTEAGSEREAAQEQAAEEGSGAGQASRPQAQANQQEHASSTRPADRADATEGPDPSQQRPPQEANPFRDLGKAVERWRARLAVSQDAGQDQADADDAAGGAAEEQPGDDGSTQAEDLPAGGEYEFIKAGEQRQAGEAQTMAAATEEQAHAAAQAAFQEAGAEGGEDGLQDMEIDDPTVPQDEDVQPALKPEQASSLGPDDSKPKGGKQKGGKQGPGGRMEFDPNQPEDDPTALDGALHNEEHLDDRQADERSFAAQLQKVTLRDEASAGAGAEASTDAEDPQGICAERLEMLRDQVAQALHGNGAQEPSDLSGAVEYGQQMWSRCEALTSGLAGELTEQLRLLLEPTKASKLAGDYRTGKRISMRKVIAYIASHFHKDKIWLRRTRPDKRTYQVVLAVDDSKSMAETGCGVFALEAVSLLAKSLARLEVGDVGLVSFGGGRGVVPLHPLTRPFTDADGPGMMSALRFDQDNTIADRPMVELLTFLKHMLDEAQHSQSSGSGYGSSDLQQLVLIVADGRFHEKDGLKRLVTEFSGKPGVLLAFIVLDNPTSSVLDMQSVSFVQGKPVLSKYIDSFPFPLYIVLRDITALPSTLADLLRQWFELSNS
ncbi:hypothetical protein WJX74_002204 [Apatococcus lobatus]|uniref:VWFA domain-containing protein n=1 Tax=Apatococcus lobatus TaxID=904363 RepID=A0AAW1RJ59_9CHLO